MLHHAKIEFLPRVQDIFKKMSFSCAWKVLIVVSVLLNFHMHSKLQKTRTETGQDNLRIHKGKLPNSLMSDESILTIWQAKHFSSERPDLSTINIHIVISHCAKDLAWMTNITNYYDISSIHIVSKCGEPILNAPAGSSKEILSNVGRNDHSYLHYITTVLDSKISETKSKEEDSIVFFLKDSNAIHNDLLYRNSYDEMIAMAASDGGFGCGTLVDQMYSAYHKTFHLRRFGMKKYQGERYVKVDEDETEFKSGFLNLNSMLVSVGTKLPPVLSQVCLGGDFAASVSNIRKVDKTVWNNLENILTRGDSIEEGHMMERMWGGLLSKPLTAFQMKILTDYSDNVFISCCLNGALTKKKVEKKQ